MVGTLVAATALALGSHSPWIPGNGYALVQLTPAASCVETVPLLQAGATSVAPSLRVFRLPAATARRLAPGLRARHALQTMELDRKAMSKANVALRVWGPGTVTVTEGQGPDLLGGDSHVRAGRKQVVVEPAATGRWAYVEVTLGGRRGLVASYSFSVSR